MSQLKPEHGIKVRLNKTYLFDPTYIDAQVEQAKDWATKTDGIVQEEGANVDYSAKAYAVGGTGTETNNAKYYAGVASAAASDDNVVAVGTDLQDANSKIKAVANNKTNIDTVAGISTDVTTVSGVASDVSTVATNISDVSAVADDMTDVTAVAGNLTNISAVADNETNINAVNSNKTNINKVASDINRVDLVADDISSVHTVAVDISNVIDVAGGITDVGTVATNIADVGTVATNISDVNDCATNMADITSASTNAALAKDWANKTGSTVDGSEYSAKYYAQQAASTLANKIDKGYAVNDFATNCITEIPQDIKLELNNGTLTLKSGSILTAPNGSQYQLTEDKTYTYSSTTDDGQYVFLASRSTGSIQGPLKLTNVFSGPIANRPAWSSSIRGMVYYASDTNKITLAGSSGWNDDWGVALPFCICTITNNVITSIDKVFNGAGYIGTVIYVLPGVKGLAAEGFNSDGTLANYGITTTALAFYTNTEATVSDSYIVRAKSGGLGRGSWTESETLAASGRTYVRSKNRVYTSNGTEQPCFRVCKYSSSSGVFTDFDIMPVSGLADEYITTALGYTPENVSNKVTSVSGSSTNTQYPSAKLLYDTKTTIESSISTTNANVSALESNKIDKGYAVNDFATNCITEIPQDINITLSSETITLKSGSVITLPNGNQLTTTSDLSTSGAGSTGKKVIFCTESGSGIHNVPIENCCSGSTDTLSGVAYHIWFDTTNLEVKYYGAGGSQQANRTLPLCIVNAENTTITSIDKVFNGIGFIGTAFFALPGMSYLFTDGLNTDGTLKFGYKKLTSLVIRNFSVGNNTYTSWLNHNGGFANNYASNVYYNAETNYVVSNDVDQRGCIAVNWTQSGGVITDFNVRPVSGLSANYINTALGYVPERAEKPLNTISTSGTISPATNTYNYIAPTGAVTLSLPASPTATIVNEIELQVNQSSAVTFTFGSNVLWGGEGAPDMGVGLWDIIFTWIKGANKWLGSYKKWTTS